MNVASRFGENLVRCRKRANLSQEELGIRASLHSADISRLERGIGMPRVDTLLKLAGALSISPSELVEGIDWTPGTSGSFSVVERERRSG
jgi:transcriptional regulator with XRE-family HTH domain